MVLDGIEEKVAFLNEFITQVPIKGHSCLSGMQGDALYSGGFGMVFQGGKDCLAYAFIPVFRPYRHIADLPFVLFRLVESAGADDSEVWKDRNPVAGRIIIFIPFAAHRLVPGLSQDLPA